MKGKAGKTIRKMPEGKETRLSSISQAEHIFSKEQDLNLYGVNHKEFIKMSKGWKETEPRKREGTFGTIIKRYSNFNNFSYLQIIKTGSGKFEVFIRTKRKTPAFVQFQRENIGTLQIITRTFKKQNQAINFAFKFMEDNPDG